MTCSPIQRLSKSACSAALAMAAAVFGEAHGPLLIAKSAIFIASHLKHARWQLTRAAGLVQFRECLMSFADRARVILADRIGREDENIAALLTISSQSFEASRGWTNQRDRISEFRCDTRRHPVRVAALRGLHDASRRIGESALRHDAIVERQPAVECEPAPCLLVSGFQVII